MAFYPWTSSEYATLGERTVKVDISGCAILPIPITDITEDVSDEIQKSLVDNGFKDAKVRSVKITGQGVAARAETGVLNVVTVVDLEIASVPSTATIENKLFTKLNDQGIVQFTGVSTTVAIQTHPENLLQSLISVAVDAFSSFAEDVLALVTSVSLAASLNDSMAARSSALLVDCSKAPAPTSPGPPCLAPRLP